MDRFVKSSSLPYLIKNYATIQYWNLKGVTNEYRSFLPPRLEYISSLSIYLLHFSKPEMSIYLLQILEIKIPHWPNLLPCQMTTLPSLYSPIHSHISLTLQGKKWATSVSIDLSYNSLTFSMFRLRRNKGSMLFENLTSHVS